jgi:hypothetical protein
MSRPGVITTLADTHYERLYIETSQAPKRVIHETFDGDPEPTRIWIGEDGVLMSKMPSESYEKRIMPYTAAMQKISESREGISGNRWELIRRFVALGMRNEAAIELAHKIYKILPSQVRVSDTAASAMYEHHTNGGDRLLTYVIDDKGEFTVRCA